MGQSEMAVIPAQTVRTYPDPREVEVRCPNCRALLFMYDEDGQGHFRIGQRCRRCKVLVDTHLQSGSVRSIVRAITQGVPERP